MKLTKTTTRHYDIQFFSSAVNFTFGEFRKEREQARRTTGNFSGCFICKHRFTDDEKPVLITVSTKGNRFACGDCFERNKADESK